MVQAIQRQESDLVFGLQKRCDICDVEITDTPISRFYLTFCSKEHMAAYLGAYVVED